jgi:hypothetical protein
VGARGDGSDVRVRNREYGGPLPVLSSILQTRDAAFSIGALVGIIRENDTTLICPHFDCGEMRWPSGEYPCGGKIKSWRSLCSQCLAISIGQWTKTRVAII